MLGGVNGFQTNIFSRAWFRSTDLWVMGPARFHCATLLAMKWRCYFMAITSSLVQGPMCMDSHLWLAPSRACGAMDNASDYGSEDSRFESWQAREQILKVHRKRIPQFVRLRSETVRAYTTIPQCMDAAKLCCNYGIQCRRFSRLTVCSTSCAKVASSSPEGDKVFSLSTLFVLL